MCFLFILFLAALGVTGWFWSAAGVAVPFFVVLTATVLLFPMGMGKENPRFVAVWQTILTAVGCILVMVLEDKAIAYAITFTDLVVIAIWKTMPIWSDDFFNVYANNEPVMIEEKLYNIVDTQLSDGLRYAVVLPVIAFYCCLLAPYILCPEYPWLAILPVVFVLYRTIRIFQLY